MDIRFPSETEKLPSSANILRSGLGHRSKSAKIPSFVLLEVRLALINM